jgi:hypothetical protein
MKSQGTTWENLLKSTGAVGSDRFSKPNLLAALERRACELQKTYGFDENNGTSQLKGKLDTQDAAVAYGKFRLFHELIQQIDDGSLLRR